MLRTALKNVLAHKLRLLTTALAVTLGVALMAGTLVLTDTMKRTFDDLFATVYGGTDAVVRARAAFDGPQGTGEQRGRIATGLIPTVRAVPGVAAVEGQIFGYARITAGDGSALGNPANGAPTLGMVWLTDRRLNPLDLVAGAPPRGPHQVVIDKKSAQDGHLAVGDTTTVLVLGPPQRMHISGIARFGSADSPGGASVAAFTGPTAQRLLARPGTIDAIDVVARPGVSQQQLVHNLSTVLPRGVEAVTGATVIAENQSQMQKALSFFNTFLLIFAVVALLVGGFMMFNTFSITVAQRTRENGLLRALGASRRQVQASVLVEALTVGAVASLLGVVVGVGIAIGLKALMSAIGIEIPAQGVTVLPGSLLLTFGIGLVVTVLAAVSPARQAARVPPIAAMQLGVAGSTGYGSKRRVAAGVAVLGSGVAALLIGLFADVPSPLQIVGLGALLVFFGMAVLGSTISLPLSRAIGLPLPRMRGVTGELARENAMRNPKRTATSASALMIGVGVVGLIAIFVSSIRASVTQSIDTTFTGDIVVDSGGGIVGGVDPALARAVNRLPEVQVAAGIRQGVAKIASSSVLVQAGDPSALLRLMQPQLTAGSTAALDAHSIAVYSAVASDHHWHVGSVLPADFARSGPTRLRVAAVYADNTQIGDYFLSLAAYRANFAGQFDHEVFVKIAPGTSTDAAVSAIKSVTAAYPGVSVLTRSAYVDAQMQPLNQLLALVYALLGLAIVIALLGIGNTLALSISERIHEIGLLRAIGMTRAQLRSTIRWESVIIAVQGTVLGLVIGVFFGWALVSALHDQGIRVFSVPVGALVVVVLAAVVAGMVAATGPSRRAAGLDVLRAVAAE